MCFNTAMTGYQEIMTDPSYARQIVCFTFPHIGNVGVNEEDVEADTPHALGCIVREDVTEPSNFRSAGRFDEWLRENGRIGLAGVDTRALTKLIREQGAPNAVIVHNAGGEFDVEALLAQARAWSGLEGLDLAKEVTREETAGWNGGPWALGQGYSAGGGERGRTARRRHRLRHQEEHPTPPDERGRACDGAAGDRELRRDHGAGAERRVPVERPRRPRGDRRVRRAGY